MSGYYGTNSYDEDDGNSTNAGAGRGGAVGGGAGNDDDTSHHETDPLLLSLRAGLPPGGGEQGLPGIEVVGSPSQHHQRPGHRHRGHGHGHGHHHRRESSMVDTVLDAIHEGVVYVEEVAVAAAEAAAAVTEGAVEAAADVVVEIRDNVATEAEEIVEAAVEEMTHADEGDSFFLEMSLSRNLSILPEDMIHIAEAPDGAHVASVVQPTGSHHEVHHPGEEISATAIEIASPVSVTAKVEEEEHVPPTSAGMHVSAYLLLASAVISLSSIGPLLDMQEGCSPTMKIFWRMSLTAGFLFPFAARQAWKEGLPRFTIPQLVTQFMSAGCYATMCVAFVLALQYTAVGNAVILANSQAIMLLVAKFLVGQPVTMMEGSGALTAFAGAALCSKDSADQQEHDGSHSALDDGEVHNSNSGLLTLLGDFFGLLSGIAGCGYLIFAKQVRTHVGLYIFMFLNMFIGCCLVLIFMDVALGEPVTWDRHIATGVWGWANTEFDRLPLEITMVIIANMLGALGYVRAMQYFDNLVISVAALMEPVVAELLALLFGVGFLPGILGWAGNALVAIGTFCVIAPSNMSHGGGKGSSYH